MAAMRLRALLLVALLGAAVPVTLPPPAGGGAGARNGGSPRVSVRGPPRGAPYSPLAGTATGGERGLLGLALAPGFPAAPYAYAYQTDNDAGNGPIYKR